MDWFYLAIISPALFALVVIIDDNLIRGAYNKSAFFGAIISGIFGSLPLLGIFLYPITPSPIHIILLGIVSGFLTIIYYFLYFHALLKDVPSIVIAIFSLSPAIIPLLEFLIFRQSLTLSQHIGFVIILTATFFLSIVDIKKFKFSKTLYLVSIAAVLNAIAAVIGKYVYSQTDFWSGYMFFCIGLLLSAVFLMISFKKGRTFIGEFKSTFKKWLWIFVIAETLNIGAEFTLNRALSLGSASLVKVMEIGLQPIFILLFALLLYPVFPAYFREATYGSRVKKLMLMVLILSGLFFLQGSS